MIPAGRWDVTAGRKRHEPHADRAGTRTPSSTSCTSGPSTTATATAIGDFAGLTEKLDYLQDLGVTAVWLLPFYPVAAEGRRLRHRRLHARQPDLRHAATTSSVFLRRGAPARPARHHRAGDQPHLRPAPVVSARRARAAGLAERELLRLERHAGQVPDARIIFKDFERSNWTWDPVAQRVLLAPLLLATSPTSTTTTRDVHEAMFTVLDFWLDMGVDGLRLDAVPYLYEREGTNCENLPETHAFLKELRAPRRREVRRPHAAGRGQPVAGGRRRVLRRRRRVPHGVSLPAHAAAVHGAAAWRTAIPILDILAADAGDPGELPVGACSCATTTS